MVCHSYLGIGADEYLGYEFTDYFTRNDRKPVKDKFKDNWRWKHEKWLNKKKVPNLKTFTELELRKSVNFNSFLVFNYSDELTGMNVSSMMIQTDENMCNTCYSNWAFSTKS